MPKVKHKTETVHVKVTKDDKDFLDYLRKEYGVSTSWLFDRKIKEAKLHYNYDK